MTFSQHLHLAWYQAVTHVFWLTVAALVMNR